MPSKELLFDAKAKKLTDEQYKERFEAELQSNRIDYTLFADKVLTLEYLGYTHAVMLCYEKPEAFCHRHILAEHINASTYLQVSELTVNDL